MFVFIIKHVIKNVLLERMTIVAATSEGIIMCVTINHTIMKLVVNCEVHVCSQTHQGREVSKDLRALPPYTTPLDDRRNITLTNMKTKNSNYCCEK